jgi:hypothetical protein
VKISKRGEYALRTLIDLGLAEAADRPLLQASELALREDFSVKFLEQILMQLWAAGYIESRRGKLGGYLLARSPGEHLYWAGYPIDRWAACSDFVRQPDRLRALQLPGRRTLRIADVDARCQERHRQHT